MIHVEYLLGKKESEEFGGKELGHRAGCKINQFYIPIGIKNFSPNFFRGSAEISNKIIKLFL